MRAAFLLAALAVALHAGRLALLAPNAHTDNLYNLGMVRHSAAAGWWPLLTTSFLHWFFEPSPVTRTEDWHRGASLVAVAALARLAGGGETLLRLPHLAWLGALWWVTWRLAVRVSPPEAAAGRRVELAAVALGLLVVLPPGPQAITGAFMDDVPATVCVGLVLLLLAGPGPLDRRTAAAAGAAAGAAFVIKDLALVWGLLAPAWVGLSSLVAPSRPGLRRSIGLAGTCLAAFLLVAAVKVGWNQADLGQPLPGPARLGMVGRNVPGVVDGEHHVWFLDRERRVDEGRLLGAGLGQLGERLALGTRLTGYALADLAPWWALAGVGVLVLRRAAAGTAAMRLAGLGALAAAGVAALGVLHLLEPLQLRYWLAAAVAACAVAAAGLVAAWRSSLGRWGRVAVLAAAVTAVGPAAADHRGAVARLGRLGGYSPAAVAAARTGGPGPLLVELARGAGLWAGRPGLAVVAVRTAPMAALDPAGMRRFVARYAVASAVVDLDAEPDLARVLLARGFTVRARFGSELVLDPPRPARL